MDSLSLVSMCVIFFLIMDPLGNVAYFLSVLESVPHSQQRFVVVREMFIALGVMIFFYLIGDWILDTLSVSDATVSITSGVILFLAAIKVLFPKPKINRLSAHRDLDPFIVPLAIPLIAGPALLATIMLFSHQFGVMTFLAILIAWTIASLVLVSSKFLLRTLGKNGLMAIEKVMGMILILLSIQRFLEGVQQMISQVQG